MGAIGKAPSVKDLDIQKRLDNITKFNLGIKDDNNDEDDDDNDNGDNSRLSSLRRAVTSSFPPTPPTTPSTLSQTQRFLLDDTTTDDDNVGGGNERVVLALAHGSSRTSTPIAKQITFSDTITKIFHKTRKLDTISEESFLKNDNEIGDVEDESSADISSVIDG